MKISEMFVRLSRVWQKHGWRLFGPLVVHNVRHYWRRYKESGRLGMPRSAVDDIPGVETQKAVYLTALTYEGPSASDAQPYEPISDRDFHAVLEALPAERAQFTFVDLGSGKGRALLLAAKAGFGSVIGIEYSTDLHRKAEANMAAATRHLPNIDRVKLINADAGDYAPPRGRVVYYLFNPFGPQVMSRVLENLERAIQRNHFDDLWILYGNPVHESMLTSRPFLERITHRAGFWVFRMRRQ